jgi:hypothetical protein
MKNDVRSDFSGPSVELVKVTGEWQFGAAIAVLAAETFTNRWKDSGRGGRVFLIMRLLGGRRQ